jgi:hypothetical protein
VRGRLWSNSNESLPFSLNHSYKLQHGIRALDLHKMHWWSEVYIGPSNDSVLPTTKPSLKTVAGSVSTNREDPCLVLGACYSLILDKDSYVLGLDKLFGLSHQFHSLWPIHKLFVRFNCLSPNLECSETRVPFRANS